MPSTKQRAQTSRAPGSRRPSRAPRPVRIAVRVVAGIFRGDRPLIVLTLVIGALGMSLLVGPAQRYFDERSRVDLLRHTEAVLDAEVRALEQRVADLHDPEHLEILAREQHGMARPGELSYVIVPPDTLDVPAGPSRNAAVSMPQRASANDWPERLWNVFGTLFAASDD